MNMWKLIIIFIVLFPVLVFADDYEDDDYPWAVGWSMGISDFSQSNRENIYNNGVTGTFTFEFHLQNYFAFGMKTGFLHFNHKQYSGDNLNIGYINLCATFMVDTKKPFRPFFFFGPGIYSQSSDGTTYQHGDGTTVYYENDRRLNAGIFAGVGFEVLFRKSIGITTSLNYHIISASDTIDILGGELGLKYYF